MILIFIPQSLTDAHSPLTAAAADDDVEDTADREIKGNGACVSPIPWNGTETCNRMSISVIVHCWLERSHSASRLSGTITALSPTHCLRHHHV